MNRLITEAKKNKSNRKNDIKKEHIELAVAWAKGEISLSGVTKVMKKGVSGATYVFLALALREYISNK